MDVRVDDKVLLVTGLLLMRGLLCLTICLP
jgi:hypothetical protein